MPPMHPSPPHIPGVDLFEILGAGSSGTVYSGVFTGGRRAHPVAVKVVPARAGDPARRVDRALQEARFCFSLDHPHVVRVFDWGRLPDQGTYIVMERLSGETLAERVQRLGPLPAGAALAIARQLVRGLAAIHSRGAIHRDVKTENIYLCDNGILPDQVKLLDLGLAALAEDDPKRMVHTAQGMVFGTPGFMSPEQCCGEPMTPASDVFSVGATLFTCLTGEPPFSGKTPRAVLVATANAAGPPALPARVPAPLARVIKGCLHPDPALRPADATALAVMLDALHLDRQGQAGFGKTTLMVGGQTMQVGDLHLPSLGDHTDHHRFRSHVVLTVARVFKPGHIPSALTDKLQQVDRLEHARQAQVAERDQTRKAADEAARDLLTRSRRLGRALDTLRQSYEAARGRYVDLSTALIEVGAALGDIDRIYIKAYRDIEQLQREEAERASLLGEPVALDGLFGAAVGREMARLRAARDQRGARLEEQRGLLGQLLEAHQEVHDLRHQLLEMERSLLGVEADREALLAPLEASARGADDEALHLERAVEHAFLELGIALQLALMQP